MFTRLSDLMPSAASKHNLSGGLKASMVVSRAGVLLKQLFPRPEVHSQMKVRSFSNGQLKVAVQSSAAAQAFQSKSHELKDLMNASMDSDVVKEIRCYQDSKEPEEDWG